MSPIFTPQAESYVLDWAITLAIGGGLFLLVGAFIGWNVWRNTRRLAEKIEEGNRGAFSEYERTNDEVAKIKSELAGER